MMSKAESKISHRRRQVLLAALLLAGTLPSSGCRICADCEDLAYPAYGGIWERTDRESGRVGSLFDPGGAKASELVDRDEPSQPDEIIRELQGDKKSDSDPDDAKDPDDPKKADPKSIPRPNLRDRKLEDIENEDEQKLREKKLDDIEVRIIPGRKPTMVKAK